MRVALVVAAALAFAAPAVADQQPPGQPLSPEIVPGAGLSGVAGVRVARFRHVRGAGITSAGRFRIDLAAGPGRKLVLVRRGAQVFRALRITSMRWTDDAVAMSGIGLAGSLRVHFVAFAVDGGSRDVFRIAWLHHASLGGVLSQGAVVIH
jgi:hypothetical protein